MVAAFGNRPVRQGSSLPKSAVSNKADADYVTHGDGKSCQSCPVFTAPNAWTKVRGKVSGCGRCRFWTIARFWQFLGPSHSPISSWRM
jgi:hypothetical protein